MVSRWSISRYVVAMCLIGTLSSPIFAQVKTDKFQAKPEVQKLIDLATEPAKEYKWDEVIKLYTAALKKAEELNDLIGQAQCFSKIGRAYYSMGDLTKTKDYFEKAKDLFAKAGDEESEMNTIGNLGILKDNTGYPNEARPLYLRHLAYFRAKKDDKRGCGWTYQPRHP